MSFNMTLITVLRKRFLKPGLIVLFFFVTAFMGYRIVTKEILEKDLIHRESNLSKQEWTELVKFTRNYLKNHRNDLSIQIIESGFVRVNIDEDSIPYKNKGIKKLRLNYWPKENDLTLSPGSIHNHTNYFESLILNGGYFHELFDFAEADEASSMDVDIWKVSKTDQIMSCLCKEKMKQISANITQKGDVVILPTTIKHLVSKGDQTTLTLNVIFQHSDAANFFYVFPPHGTSYEDIKVDRPVVISKHDEIISQILQILDDFIIIY